MKLFWGILLLFPSLAFGKILWEEALGPFQARLEAESATVSLNENVEMTLKLNFPADYSLANNYIYPQSSTLPVPPFEILSLKKTETIEKDQKELTLTYTLMPMTEGTFPLSFFEIPFQKNNSKESLFSPVFSLEVKKAAPNPQFQLAAAPLLPLEALNPIEINEENRQKLLLKADGQTILETVTHHSFPFLPVLLVLIAAFLLPLLLHLLAKKKILSPEKMKLNAKTIALNSLHSFDRQIAALNTPEPVMTQQISLVMRLYIQQRFGINAPHLTTEEFLTQAAANTAIDAEAQEKLKVFLKQADLVKFGHKETSLRDLKDSLNFAKQFVVSS